MSISYLKKDEQTFTIPGPAGLLEVVTTPAQGQVRPGIAIVCHPHPLFGGTMNNKVVTTLVSVLSQQGLPTIRFNFRGVGLSEGKFDQGVGELDDLLAVIAWMQKTHGSQPIWLAGFSFGAYVAAKAASQLDNVNTLITVAPPASRFPLQSLPPIHCRWILVQGEKDEVVSPQAVFDWVASLSPAPTLIRFENAGHFFHGDLAALKERIEQAL